MKIIGSKAEISEVILPLIEVYKTQSTITFIKKLYKDILKKKIRYPLLEYVATELYNAIPEKEQLNITDKIVDLNENGCSVLAGIILQLRLQKHFKESIHKAVEYIVRGDEWLVCDTIAERVMGYALLTQPGKTIPVLKKLIKHPENWVVRAIGVATHYAVKKGLKKEFVKEQFQLLLLCANAYDFHVKTGIGWGAKTVAKFYPDIIEQFKSEIELPEVKQWFKTKIKIGLSRSYKYASRYPG